MVIAPNDEARVQPTEATTISGAARPRAEGFMAIALAAARRAGLAGEVPIGACLVRGDRVIASGANSIIASLDITAHAEMNLIREACEQLRTLRLDGCELYVTVEPCGMCLAACHYAHINRVVFGARLADLHALTGDELPGPDSRPPGGDPTLIGDCLRADSLALLQAWAARRTPG
jgi:tRNA(Arg) A34 adenosine deaminase TadA